jgi:hypothetical protein
MQVHRDLEYERDDYRDHGNMTNPIDPREFGRLEAEVDLLKQEVHLLRNDIKSLLELANKSKGGFWVGMGVASIVGGIVSFLVDKIA